MQGQRNNWRRLFRIFRCADFFLIRTLSDTSSMSSSSSFSFLICNFETAKIVDWKRMSTATAATTATTTIFDAFVQKSQTALPTLCNGYLYNQPETNSLIWKRRYCVLQESSLSIFYYENEEEAVKGNLKGKIPYSSVHKWDGKPNGFQVRSAIIRYPMISDVQRRRRCKSNLSQHKHMT